MRRIVLQIERTLVDEPNFPRGERRGAFLPRPTMGVCGVVQYSLCATTNAIYTCSISVVKSSLRDDNFDIILNATRVTGV